MNKFKRLAIAGAAGALLFGSLAIPTFAAGPVDPGCFGAGRAAYANVNGSLGNQVGGVGYYASLRASDNGAENMAYMLSCGGVPTQ